MYVIFVLFDHITSNLNSTKLWVKILKKKNFLIFLTPQGAPWGGLSENFQHD